MPLPDKERGPSTALPRHYFQAVLLDEACKWG